MSRNHAVGIRDMSTLLGYVPPVVTLSAEALADPAKLGVALRSARKAANLSQGELAEKLNEQQSWVSRMERGENPIEIPKMVAWFLACGQGVGLQWGEAGTLPVTRVPDAIEALPAADRELLARAAPLLDRAPTARKRLAFDVEMWGEEARAAAVTATVASVAAQISGALQGRDADVLRILQERVGLTPATATSAGARAQAK
jgi:transcriptional regulator with XRE-family HTH domain